MTSASQVGHLALRAFLRTVRQPGQMFFALVFPHVFLAVIASGLDRAKSLPGFPADSYVEFMLAIPFVHGSLFTSLNAATELGRDIELRMGDAQALDLPDGQFDTVVATLTLCSIPDDRRAVAEARRVLRPGGRFLLFEHVRSPLLPVRLLQRLLDPLFVHCYGDHLLREPLDHLAAAGFVVERVERSKGGMIERLVARTPVTTS